MNFNRTIFFTAIACSMIACKTPKAAWASGASPAAGDGKTTATVDSKNYILTVIVKASRKAGDSTIVFEIAKVAKKEGKLKPGQNDNSGTVYAVSFTDAQQKPMQTYYIQHPLDIALESADESGKLETKPLSRNEAFFNVRTNYTPDMKYLVIKKNNNTETNKTVIPLNIQ